MGRARHHCGSGTLLGLRLPRRQQAAQWAQRAAVPELFTHAGATDAQDDPQELADRIAALHERIATPESDGSSMPSPGAGSPTQYAGLPDEERHEQRREQLARWHHDDHPEHDSTDEHTHGAGGGHADEQVWVCDDAPGLP